MMQPQMTWSVDKQNIEIGLGLDSLAELEYNAYLEPLTPNRTGICLGAQKSRIPIDS
jgi:hypothetical protein